MLLTNAEPKSILQILFSGPNIHVAKSVYAVYVKKTKQNNVQMLSSYKFSVSSYPWTHSDFQSEGIYSSYKLYTNVIFYHSS